MSDWIRIRCCTVLKFDGIKETRKTWTHGVKRIRESLAENA